MKFSDQGEDILEQCQQFLENSKRLGYQNFESLPVFVDWNIGNFSVDKDFHFSICPIQPFEAMKRDFLSSGIVLIVASVVALDSVGVPLVCRSVDQTS